MPIEECRKINPKDPADHCDIIENKEEEDPDCNTIVSAVFEKDRGNLAMDNLALSSVIQTVRQMFDEPIRILDKIFYGPGDLRKIVMDMAAMNDYCWLEYYNQRIKQKRHTALRRSSTQNPDGDDNEPYINIYEITLFIPLSDEGIGRLLNKTGLLSLEQVLDQIGEVLAQLDMDTASFSDVKNGQLIIRANISSDRHSPITLTSKQLSVLNQFDLKIR